MSMSLPREDLRPASWCLSTTIPASVRDISCSTPASWLASVSRPSGRALRFPDSLDQQRPSCSSSRVTGHPRSAPPPSRRLRCPRTPPPRWPPRRPAPSGTGRRRGQPHPDLGQLGLRADSCSLAWSSCWLTLSNWAASWLILAGTWLTVGWGAASAPGEDRDSADQISPAAIATPAANPGRAARLPRTHVPTTPHHVPACPAFAQVLDPHDRPGDVWGQRSEANRAIQPIR